MNIPKLNATGEIPSNGEVLQQNIVFPVSFQGWIGSNGELIFTTKTDITYALLCDDRIFSINVGMLNTINPDRYFNRLSLPLGSHDLTVKSIVIKTLAELKQLRTNIGKYLRGENEEVGEEESNKAILEYHTYLIPEMIQDMIENYEGDINSYDKKKKEKTLYLLHYVHNNNVYLREDSHLGLKNKVRKLIETLQILN